jgi:hypothetical protein
MEPPRQGRLPRSRIRTGAISAPGRRQVLLPVASSVLAVTSAPRRLPIRQRLSDGCRPLIYILASSRVPKQFLFTTEPLGEPPFLLTFPGRRRSLSPGPDVPSFWVQLTPVKFS